MKNLLWGLDWVVQGRDAREKPEAETRFALPTQDSGSVAVFSAGGGPRLGAAAAVCRWQQHSILNDMGQINLPQVVTAGDFQTAGVDAVGTGGAGQAEV